MVILLNVIAGEKHLIRLIITMLVMQRFRRLNLNILINKWNKMKEIKFKINNADDRKNIVTALANSGYFVKIEEIQDPAYCYPKTIYNIIIEVNENNA
jgi:hypothetical protein